MYAGHNQTGKYKEEIVVFLNLYYILIHSLVTISALEDKRGSHYVSLRQCWTAGSYQASESKKKTKKKVRVKKRNSGEE